MRSYTAALAASPLFFLAVAGQGIIDNMAPFDTISVSVLVFPRSGLFSPPEKLTAPARVTGYRSQVRGRLLRPECQDGKVLVL